MCRMSTSIRMFEHTNEWLWFLFESAFGYYQLYGVSSLYHPPS